VRPQDVGPAAASLLRGETTVALREDRAAPAAKGGASAAAPRRREAPADLDDPEDHARFERLRAVRTAIAREAGVPPYVVFHDATLREMAVRRPRDEAELADVQGVGAAKLARYGARFLAALEEG
jgi:ATP-dependent DNA helicase RecQ